MISDEVMVKLKYENTTQLATSGGDIGEMIQITGNSTFGLQPTGHDQWYTFFNRAKVCACKVVARMANTTTVSTVEYPIVTFIFPSSTNYGTTVATLLTDGGPRQPWWRQRLVGNPSGSSITTMKHYMTTKKVFGMDLVEDHSWWETSGAAAQTLWWWYFGIYDPSNTANRSSAAVEYTVTFYVKFFQRLDVANS